MTNGKTLKANLGLYQHQTGTIALTVNGKLTGQVSGNPSSKNYNEVLFKEFKALLQEAGKWEEGNE